MKTHEIKKVTEKEVKKKKKQRRPARRAVVTEQWSGDVT